MLKVNSRPSFVETVPGFKEKNKIERPNTQKIKNIFKKFLILIEVFNQMIDDYMKNLIINLISIANFKNLLTLKKIQQVNPNQSTTNSTQKTQLNLLNKDSFIAKYLVIIQAKVPLLYEYLLKNKQAIQLVEKLQVNPNSVHLKQFLILLAAYNNLCLTTHSSDKLNLEYPTLKTIKETQSELVDLILEDLSLKPFLELQSVEVNEEIDKILSSYLMQQERLYKIGQNFYKAKTTKQKNKLEVEKFLEIFQKMSLKLGYLENHFWEEISNNREFSRYFEICINNGQEVYIQAKQLVEIYLANLYEAQRKTITTGEKEELTFLVAGQLYAIIENYLNIKESNLVRANFSEPAPNIRRFTTRGDGSCGLHAMFGENINGVYQYKEIRELRQEICNKIKHLHKEKRLHESSGVFSFYTILSDYILDFKYSPQFFRNSLRAEYDRIMKDYEELTNAEKDKRIEDFIYSDAVINTYVAHIQEVTSFLLQDELEVIADLYGKRLIIFQNGWGNDASVVLSNIPDALQEGFALKENDVCIWYMPRHFEKVELKK